MLDMQALGIEHAVLTIFFLSLLSYIEHIEQSE